MAETDSMFVSPLPPTPGGDIGANGVDDESSEGESGQENETLSTKKTVKKIAPSKSTLRPAAKRNVAPVAMKAPRSASAAQTVVRRGKTVPISKPNAAKTTRKIAVVDPKAKTKEAAGGGIKKPHRFRPGTVALRDIRFNQKNAHKAFAIKKLPFERVVREIVQNQTDQPLKIKRSALEALQQGTEEFASRMFTGAMNNVCISRVQTLYPEHLLVWLLTDEVGYNVCGHLISDDIVRGLGMQPRCGPNAFNFRIN